METDDFIFLGGNVIEEAGEEEGVDVKSKDFLFCGGLIMEVAGDGVQSELSNTEL